ncbi:flagellar protein FlaG [Salinibius halmophilus]|uniref:flagellar protein FlaG n=1 Tax=Salinibius halmophilus TaxID=1853216 RepID=UPI000E66CF09|nr:flagellar protein FlaG [Salinibius halmophilus]
MSEINLNTTRPAVDAGGKKLPPEPTKKADLATQEVEPALVAKAEAKADKANEDAQAQQTTNPEAMQDVVAKLNDHVQNIERKLNFQMDEDSGRTIVQVFDKETDELIRQIPNEEALELARNLKDNEPFGLFSAQV